MCTRKWVLYKDILRKGRRRAKPPRLYYAYSDWLRQEKALSDVWFSKDVSQTCTILYADFLLDVSSKKSLVRSCSFFEMSLILPVWSGRWGDLWNRKRVWATWKRTMPISFLHFLQSNHPAAERLAFRIHDGCLTVHLPQEMMWNANLMQQGNVIDVFLARHVSGTYAHHQEH